MEETYNWVYGEDWAVSITLRQNVTLEDAADPIMLPEKYLRPETEKNGIV